ncbi:F-box/kelch-repeat protein [Forsythia ovata]|uniref:F-box/kelch-repeat protein n=1 Tax=Forsythia ovata TaxID=205694 RepID=A0ABD1PZU4_9LAMI
MRDSHDIFSSLPQDVIFQILLKLPTKSLLLVRCVSKSFASLISHHHFLKLVAYSAATGSCDGGTGDPRHLLYYESTDYTKQYISFHGATGFSLCKRLEAPFKSVHGYLRLVGSSSGLICFFDTNYFTYIGTVILWNPLIRKFQILPDTHRFHRFTAKFSHTAVGFGFDHKIFDFKVVQILHDWDYECESGRQALVYGIKNESWRKIEVVVPCFMLKNWSSNVFVNGAVHWLAYTRTTADGRPNCIMAFNISEEVFKVMQLPQDLELNFRESRLSPSVDEKSLAMFISYSNNAGERWDMWLMNEYGKVESWTRKYSIVQNHMVPLKFVNNGEDLLAMSNENLVLIDLEKEETKNLEVSGLPLSFYTAGFVPSLALLDDGQRCD